MFKLNVHLFIYFTINDIINKFYKIITLLDDSRMVMIELMVKLLLFRIEILLQNINRGEMMSQPEITRILVIVNDQVTADRISKELKKKQWIVDIAYTADDGLEAYRQETFDALCIEYVIPDTDGLPVIEELLAWDEHPPMLIMTAAGSEEGVKEIYRPGVDDYIIRDDEGRYLDLLGPKIEIIMRRRRDEVERGKAHKGLQESADQSGDTAESLTEGVRHAGTDDRVVYTSPRTADTPGYTTDEIYGARLIQFTNKRKKETVRANRKRQDRESGGPDGGEDIQGSNVKTCASLEAAPVCDDTDDRIEGIAEQAVEGNASEEAASRTGAAREKNHVPEADTETLDLTDIIEVPAIQSMLDYVHELTNISMAIIDVNGTVLAATEWHDICTKFHRVHPESAKHCLESDIELSSGVSPGEFKLYRCKNNMLDMVTPIMVGDRHVGNLFMGQFFFDDEPMDYERFRSQAETYGFDEEEYLAALEKIPRKSRKTLNTIMSFFSEFAMTISKLGYSNIRLSGALTERDTLLERLGDSERRYRRIIDTSPAMLFLIRDGKYIYANPAAARELGYENPGHFVDLPVEEIIAPESRKVLSKRMKRLTENSVANPPIELRINRTDGSTLISESTSIPIHLEDGDAILVMGRNITGRKIAEDALRESESKYRGLFDTSMDVVFLSTTEGQFIDINRAGEELFGYSREELLTMDSHDLLLNPSDLGKYIKIILEQGFVKNFEIVFKKKDETPIESIVTATVRRTAEGDTIGYQGFIKDISDLKRTQNQLIQAQKMEAVGTLAGGIAHDFNNVLATIMGYSSFLKNKVSRGEELYDGLELIEKASTRASELTSQLLTYTRKTVRKVKAINLNRVLREVHTLISKTFDKSIRIHLNTAENIPTIEGDESQIYQVIMNVSVNAQHAMPDGGDLTMETYEEVVSNVREKTFFSINPGRYVCLKITDTGIGMNEETLSKVFEPYFTTRSDSGGSGLGMSVAFGIVQSHNGYIDIVSDPGRGSQVVISFPVSEKKEINNEIEQVDIDGGTEDILVIDDEMMILQMTSDILEESGYTVRTALSGKEGIEMAEGKMPDLVILDLKMPEMDGIEVLKRLMDIDPNVSILMASGYVEEDQKNEILDMGVSGFIHKPFSADNLKKYIRYILNRPNQ